MKIFQKRGAVITPMQRVRKLERRQQDRRHHLDTETDIGTPVDQVVENDPALADLLALKENAEPRRSDYDA
jgi:hypothetical protein